MPLRSTEYRVHTYSVINMIPLVYPLFILRLLRSVIQMDLRPPKNHGDGANNNICSS